MLYLNKIILFFKILFQTKVFTFSLFFVLFYSNWALIAADITDATSENKEEKIFNY